MIDMGKVYRQTNLENLEQAFSVGERELGVTRLLDPEGKKIQPAGPICLLGLVYKLTSKLQISLGLYLLGSVSHGVRL